MIPCAHNQAASHASAQIASGLKIPRGKTRAGSIPASGTSKHAQFHVSGHYQNRNRERIVSATVGAWGPTVQGFDSLHPLHLSRCKYTVFPSESAEMRTTAGRGIGPNGARFSHGVLT